jgi:type I restriction enzyme S subunit
LGLGAAEQVADVFGGLTKNPVREKMDDQAPYLRVANIQIGALDLNEMKLIGVTAEDRKRAALAYGDVLVVEGNGSIDQIGRCALWREEITGCVHQNHIIKVRLTKGWLSEWTLTWLLSPSGRSAIERVASSTSGLHTLSISKIESLPVPVLPQPESTEILRRVSDALAAAADTLRTLEAEAADAARLKQSVLKAAFEGRLVPQDSTDEPASALLARIASAATPSVRKRGKAAKG